MNGRIHVSLLPLGCSKIGPDVSELYEEAEKQDKEVDVEAMTVTGLPKPERPRLPSERHEMMMQVWEAVRHVGDANGRDRGIGFCRLPPRREADYYNKIQRPLHLMRVRGMIEKQRFHDVATFEVDMSTVFRNARQFYGPETQVYIDALILEEVFWAALQAVEKGETYSVPPDWVGAPSRVAVLVRCALARAPLNLLPRRSTPRIRSTRTGRLNRKTRRKKSAWPRLESGATSSGWISASPLASRRAWSAKSSTGTRESTTSRSHRW